jgi:proton-translocating NAD(P)+ transhydrogenase subunit alpha
VNLPSSVPFHASQMYGRNVTTLLQHLAKDGRLALEPQDEIAGPMLVVHDGQVRVQEGREP